MPSGLESGRSVKGVLCLSLNTYCHLGLCCRFRATLYQCPESAQERADMSAAVNNRIVDLQLVLQTTQDHSNTQLEDIAQEVDTWRQKV